MAREAATTTQRCEQARRMLLESRGRARGHWPWKGVESCLLCCIDQVRVERFCLGHRQTDRQAGRQAGKQAGRQCSSHVPPSPVVRLVLVSIRSCEVLQVGQDMLEGMQVGQDIQCQSRFSFSQTHRHRQRNRYQHKHRQTQADLHPDQLRACNKGW